MASIAAYLAWRKRAGGRARMVLTALLPVILLLQLPVSDVIWKHTPHMKFLQFPWRWLLALSVVTCVLAGMAVDEDRAGRTAMLAAVIDRRHGDRRRPALLPALRRRGCGGGTDRRLPPGARHAGHRRVHAGGSGQLPPSNSTCPWCACCVPRRMTPPTAARETTRSGEPETPAASRHTVDAKRWNGEHWMVNVVTPETGYAVLRLMDYPSWRVTVDGKPAQGRPVRDDGLMAVPVTAGKSRDGSAMDRDQGRHRRARSLRHRIAGAGRGGHAGAHAERRV